MGQDYALLPSDNKTRGVGGSVGSSYRLQLGHVGELRTLVMAEVDAVDETGGVVEIKSNPKMTADLLVQNMMCGVSRRVAAIGKKVRAPLVFP